MSGILLFSSPDVSRLILTALAALVLVSIPILVTLILFIREIRHRFGEAADDTMTYWLRVGALTGLLAIAFQEVVEFSLQISGNAVLFTVLAAVAIHRPPAEQTRRNVSS